MDTHQKWVTILLSWLKCYAIQDYESTPWIHSMLLQNPTHVSLLYMHQLFKGLKFSPDQGEYFNKILLEIFDDQRNFEEHMTKFIQT